MEGSVKITVVAGKLKHEIEVTGLQDTSDKLKVIREVLKEHQSAINPCMKNE